MSEKVSFVASFPPIQTAIRFSGTGDGARILLDIPETEMANAVKLLLYRQCAIRVTIEPYEQPKEKSNEPRDDFGVGTRTVKRTATKRRK